MEGGGGKVQQGCLWGGRVFFIFLFRGRSSCEGESNIVDNESVRFKNACVKKMRLYIHIL